MKEHFKITGLIYLSLYSVISFIAWEVLTPITTIKAIPDMPMVGRVALLVLVGSINVIPFMIKDMRELNKKYKS